MSNRVEKINETLKQELSHFIQFELKDPRLKDKMISVMRVEATADMRYAKVYVSIFENDPKKKEGVLEALKKSSGFLRKQIGKKLTTYSTPELIFELDESIDYGAHIDHLLHEIKKEDK